MSGYTENDGQRGTRNQMQNTYLKRLPQTDYRHDAWILPRWFGSAGRDGLFGKRLLVTGPDLRAMDRRGSADQRRHDGQSRQSHVWFAQRDRTDWTVLRYGQDVFSSDVPWCLGRNGDGRRA